jgi:hypothetical protein
VVGAVGGGEGKTKKLTVFVTRCRRFKVEGDDVQGELGELQE